jgi:hypothetical protein
MGIHLPRNLRQNDILTIILVCLLTVSLISHLWENKPKKVIMLRESNVPRHRIVYTKGSAPKSPNEENLHGNATDKTPLCLIGTWDEKKFPDYGYFALESIVENGPDFVKMFLFYHSTIENLPDPANYPNIEFINVAQLSEEYLFDGFAAFYGDKMCSIFSFE